MMRCFICCHNGIPIVSYDKGQTWNNTSLQMDFWYSSKMSNNGKLVISKCSGFSETQGSYLSLDFGYSWNKKNTNGLMDCSDDGQYIAYINTGLYLSIDHGNSFNKITSVSGTTYYSLAVSAKGQFIIINCRKSLTDIFYISADYGQTFIQINAPMTLSQIDYISDDGLLIYAQNSR